MVTQARIVPLRIVSPSLHAESLKSLFKMCTFIVHLIILLGVGDLAQR